MKNKKRLALAGFVLIFCGAGLYLTGVLLAIPRRFFFNSDLLRSLNEALVWYSGIPMISGIVLVLLDLYLLYPIKRSNRFVKFAPVTNKSLTVVLTAYNDELSIRHSINDFKSHPCVKRVVVISNNSSDNTLEVAKKSGAIVFNESLQGYGACVYRALSEGIKFKDTELIILCEGDMTFRAYDIDKLLAFISHADIVSTSRTIEQLRDKKTQLSTFMFYGNFFVAKLLEIKHLGNATLSDVGSTFKLFRNKAIKKLLPKLKPTINLEFNPYFLDIALQNNLKIIECPITFHKRIGISKGGNLNNSIALKLGVSMIKGILTKW
jgi:glycosyltransferase involved in cell wall biosynthesis